MKTCVLFGLAVFFSAGSAISVDNAMGEETTINSPQNEQLVAVATNLRRRPSRTTLFRFNDPKPQRYDLSARASKIDPRTKEYPKIDFVFELKGKVTDLERASVDTRVRPRGKLVIWLMGHNKKLTDRLCGYGFHTIQVHYANRWFTKLCKKQPIGDMCRGNIRLEAATGNDHSTELDLAHPDGMMERSLQFIKWLAKENPQGGWGFYLTKDQKNLRWEHIIMAGSSHGSTTAARFAIHQKVSRVVMFCGPRDHFQNWQKLPSATPRDRFFGFSHVLDTGWSGDHYCRSWELLGMNKFGRIVNVDKTRFPYAYTRRLITDFNVKGNTQRAHGSVVPGSSAKKNKDGTFAHEQVWKYLFTHPVKKTGTPKLLDPGCEKDHRKNLVKSK